MVSAGALGTTRHSWGRSLSSPEAAVTQPRSEPVSFPSCAAQTPRPETTGTLNPIKSHEWKVQALCFMSGVYEKNSDKSFPQSTNQRPRTIFDRNWINA